MSKGEPTTPDFVRLFHEFQRIAEGADLNDAKDAALNFLGTCITGSPEICCIEQADGMVDRLAADLKRGIRQNWEGRELHPAMQ